YSMTTVDPADGMTFWHVNEYYATTSSFNWHTRIGKFNFARPRPTPTYTTFDVPGAFGTIPIFINPMGTITGDYLGADFTFHGFVRAPNGTITTFDAPGAVNGTMPSGGITPNGTITGSIYDADFTLHGFVRAPGGAIATFDVPGAVNGTTSSGI